MKSSIGKTLSELASGGMGGGTAPPPSAGADSGKPMQLARSVAGTSSSTRGSTPSLDAGPPGHGGHGVT